MPEQITSETSAPAAARPGLYVVSAPSGAGKTSLVHQLVRRDSRVRLSVSCTTRPRRHAEIDGEDYIFMDSAAFEAGVADGAFLEHAEVFGNRYGTPRARVGELTSAGHAVLLEIDWQGARQVREAAPGCVTIFILPPSREELERRLRGRSTDSEAVIARRLGEAVADMSHWSEFDYVLVNDDFEESVTACQAIVAGRGDASRADRPGLARLIESLLAGG